MSIASYETLVYDADGPIATIWLNRPEHLNTIVPPMTDELEAAVGRAIRDHDVKVIVLRGAGRAFCAGFNFSGGFHQWDEEIASDGRWDPGRDFIMTLSNETGWVPKFMSLWHSPKPVIAMVHGWCLGGGSEMALCADIVLMSEDARIGTPYSRMWGCHHAGMWVYRLGLAKCKELALTGRPLSGIEAVEAGLINRSVPFEQLEDAAYELAQQLCSIPLSQLTAMKLIVNQAYENMGLKSTPLLGSALDGMLRNTPEALEFIELAERDGVPEAVAQRDGPFNDYSIGPREGKPNPANAFPSPVARS
jgi:enoyl-CoA hydratase